MRSQSTTLRTLLANPLAGFAPWIVMSVVVGPHRFAPAVGLAFALAVLIGAAGIAVGIRPKALDVVGVIFFGALILAGLVVHSDGLHWLERWSGELSNVVIALVALVSIVIGRPFTSEYARDTTPREHWDSPLFMHVNAVLTWAWTIAFAIAAVAGYIGDGPLGQPNNIWTNWIIQIGAIILALRFTDWYPDHAGARAAARAQAGPAERERPSQRRRSAPSLRALALPLAGYIVPVGIVVLIAGGAPLWVGIALIAIGAITTHRLRESVSPRRS